MNKRPHKGLKRTPFKRKPPKPSKDGTVKPRKGLKAGKKTKEWDTIRAELKDRFLAIGITYCEINYDSSCRKSLEGFAHTLKRRNMGKWDSVERESNLREVVGACNHCHDKVEVLGESTMKEILTAIIIQREDRLKKWKKIT